MRIGIDARVLEKKMTGIGRYLSDILKGIPIYDNKNEYTLYSVKRIKSLETLQNIKFYKTINTGKKKIPDKLYSPYWLNSILPALIENDNIDIFFSPNNLLPVKKLNCKSIVTIHDINHLVNKKHLPFFYRGYLHFQLPYTIKNSDVIITISENSKNDLIKFFNIKPEKIKVIYLTADPKFKPYLVPDNEYIKIKNSFNLPQKYILYVGVIEKRKNILGILKIADIVIKERPDLKFLLVGRPGHGYNDIEKEIQKRKNVIYLNHIEEEFIVLIYNLAFLFLFPSYYEGFGLPPLEAMQCGIPVLSSNIQSIREVVGNNGFLHEPTDYNAFANDILELDSNLELYAEMKNRSIKQAKNFSYEDSILKLLLIFNELKNN